MLAPFNVPMKHKVFDSENIKYDESYLMDNH